MTWHATSLLNVALIGVAVFFLGYYVLQANVLAADTYQAKTLKEQLSSIQETHGSLMADRAIAENPAALAQFAQSHNMVVAKDATRIFNNGGVALSR